MPVAKRTSLTKTLAVLAATSAALILATTEKIQLQLQHPRFHIQPLRLLLELPGYGDLE